MKASLAVALIGGIAIGAATAAEKPRIYITESQTPQVSGEAHVADVKGALSLTGGSSPQSVEVIKAFSQRCPAVTITSSREKADYVVRFDHEEPSPVTPFTRGNKVAIFDKNEDLVFSGSTRLLSSAVKEACAAITRK
jgi:hypothetical protein